MARLDPTGVSRILSYIKTWVTTALGGKANSSHNHTKSQITDFPTIPSSTSQLTNDSGYITSSGSCNYANSAGSAGSATTAEAVSTSVAADSSKALVYSSMADNDFCRILVGGSSNAGYVEIATADDGNEPIYVRQYTGVFSTVTRTLTLLDGSGNTQFPGTVTATTFSGNLNGNCSGSCNYANSAGSSSIATRDSGGTWISGRDNAVVKQTRHSTDDGNSWNPAVSVKTKSGNWTIGTVGYDKLQFSYDTDEDYNTGNNRNTVVELNPESGTIITSANIGSQSVNYATNSGYTNWLRTSSHTDHLFHTEWDGSYFWTYVTAGDGGYRAVRVERSNSSGYADSAGGVAWDNVSGKPSAFTPYFANGTWYNVGDDAAIGDHNVGGGLGVCGLNSNTRIDFCQYNNAGNYKSITFDGTTLYMNGNCDYATNSGSSTYSTYLNSLGAQTPKSGRDIFHPGVYTYTTYTDTNTPAHYGAVIGYGNGQGGSCEMFAEWVGSGKLWFRVLRDCDDSWTSWEKINTESNTVLNGYRIYVG